MIMISSPEAPPLEIGRVRGLPIAVGRSWPYLALLLLLFLLGPEDLSIRGLANTGATAILWLVCLAAAVIVHELGHLGMARLLRVPVDTFVIDVWGGHLNHMPIQRRPWRDVALAVAGPLANLTVAGVCWLGRDVALWQLVVGPLMVLNLVLCVYNSIPGLPLDAGHVVMGVVWWLTGSRTAGEQVAAWAGRFTIVTAALLLLAVPSLTTGGPPQLVTIFLVPPVVILTWRATTARLRMVKTRRVTDLIPLVDLARPAATASGHTRLDTIDARYRPGSGVVVLDDQERPIGILEVGTGPQTHRDRHTVKSTIAEPPGRDWVLDVDYDDTASDAAETLIEHGLMVMAVRFPDDRYGLVWRADVDARVHQAKELANA